MVSRVHHKGNRGAHPMPNDPKRATAAVKLRKPGSRNGMIRKKSGRKSSR